MPVASAHIFCTVVNPRLELTVTGEVISDKEVKYLIATAQLKNTGLTNFDMQQRGTALRVFSYLPAEKTIRARTADLHRLATFSVFEDHEWIEPGEVVEEQRLIVLPDSEHFALQLELRVVSNGISWVTRTVVTTTPKEDSSSHT